MSGYRLIRLKCDIINLSGGVYAESKVWSEPFPIR